MRIELSLSMLILLALLSGLFLHMPIAVHAEPNPIRFNQDLTIIDALAQRQAISEWLMERPDLAAANPTTAEEAMQTTAKWTFMVYMAADNDLEPFAINDLLEMQGVGSNENVNIVVQTDRAEGYENFNGTWTDTRRFFVTQAGGTTSAGDFQIDTSSQGDTFRQLFPQENTSLSPEEYENIADQLANASPVDYESFMLQQLISIPPGGGTPLIGLQQQSLESLGEVNMGDPQTLVDFATWAISQFPAEHYALVLWDHGGGWTSLAVDDSAEHDALSMAEIDAALAAIIEQTGIGKFDLIGFDACLMAQLEVQHTVAPYAQVSIASEQTIPGAGWEYTTPLAALSQNPDMTAAEFGQIVVDSYMTFYSQWLAQYPEHDLSVFDLTQIDGVTAALDNFSSVVAANPQGVLSALGDARSNAQIFGADTPDNARAYSSTDLVHFMELLSQLSPDAAVSSAAQGVIDAVSQFVVYHKTSEAQPGSRGMTIYFPINLDDYALIGGEERYSLSVPPTMASWQSFLNTFHGTANQVLAGSPLSIEITNVIPSGGVSSIYDPPVILFNTDGQELVNISFIATLHLEGGIQLMLDQSPLIFPIITPDGEQINDFPQGFSQNQFAWNVEMSVITDGSTEAFTVLLLSSSDATDGIASGIFVDASSGEQTEAFISFNLETREAGSVWGVDVNAEGSAPFEIQPRPGDQFIPTWRFLDENNEVVIVSSDIILTFKTTPFTFSFQPAASGEYTITMLAEDLAGNVVTDSAEITIDNEGLDTAYRGFKDLDFGINFLYPWEWSDPTTVDMDDGSISIVVTDPTGDINIVVYAYTDTDLQGMLDIGNSLLEGLTDLVIYDLVDAPIGGYGGYVLPYDYTADGVPHSGALTITYVPDTGMGYVIDLDTTEALLDTASPVLDTMIASLNFFAPVATAQ